MEYVETRIANACARDPAMRHMRFLSVGDRADGETAHKRTGGLYMATAIPGSMADGV